MVTRTTTRRTAVPTSTRPKVKITRKVASATAPTPQTSVVTVTEQLPRRVPRPRRRPRQTPQSQRLPSWSARPRMAPLRMVHKEMFATLVKGENNKVFQSWFLNAGNNLQFPWFEGVARNFDLYRLNSVTYSYVPSCSTYASGQVLIAFDYDPADTNASTEVTTYTMWPSRATGAVYEPLQLTLDLSRTRNPNPTRYIAASPTDYVDRLSSYGKFYVVSTAIENTTTLGTLHISYNVELIDPYVNLNSSQSTLVQLAAIKNASGVLPPIVVPASSLTTQTYNVAPVLETAVNGLPPGSFQDILTDATIKQVGDGIAKLLEPAKNQGLCNGDFISALTSQPTFSVGAHPSWNVILMPPLGLDGTISISYRFELSFTVASGQVDDVYFGLLGSAPTTIVNIYNSYGKATDDGIPDFPLEDGDYHVIIMGTVDLQCQPSKELAFVPYVAFNITSGTVLSGVSISPGVLSNNTPGKYYWLTARAGGAVRNT